MRPEAGKGTLDTMLGCFRRKSQPPAPHDTAPSPSKRGHVDIQYILPPDDISGRGPPPATPSSPPKPPPRRARRRHFSSDGEEISPLPQRTHMDTSVDSTQNSSLSAEHRINALDLDKSHGSLNGNVSPIIAPDFQPESSQSLSNPGQETHQGNSDFTTSFIKQDNVEPEEPVYSFILHKRERLESDVSRDDSTPPPSPQHVYRDFERKLPDSNLDSSTQNIEDHHDHPDSTFDCNRSNLHTSENFNLTQSSPALLIAGHDRANSVSPTDSLQDLSPPSPPDSLSSSRRQLVFQDGSEEHVLQDTPPQSPIHLPDKLKLTLPTSDLKNSEYQSPCSPDSLDDFSVKSISNFNKLSLVADIEDKSLRGPAETPPVSYNTSLPDLSDGAADSSILSPVQYHPAHPPFPNDMVRPIGRPPLPPKPRHFSQSQSSSSEEEEHVDQICTESRTTDIDFQETEVKVPTENEEHVITGYTADPEHVKGNPFVNSFPEHYTEETTISENGNLGLQGGEDSSTTQNGTTGSAWSYTSSPLPPVPPPRTKRTPKPVVPQRAKSPEERRRVRRSTQSIEDFDEKCDKDGENSSEKQQRPPSPPAVIEVTHLYTNSNHSKEEKDKCEGAGNESNESSPSTPPKNGTSRTRKYSLTDIETETIIETVVETETVIEITPKGDMQSKFPANFEIVVLNEVAVTPRKTKDNNATCEDDVNKSQSSHDEEIGPGSSTEEKKNDSHCIEVQDDTDALIKFDIPAPEKKVGGAMIVGAIVKSEVERVDNPFLQDSNHEHK